jgi:pseudouridine-5'-phosphate glycosidase
MDVVLSEEVAAARAAGAAVVVLESSVLAQGLPFPESLEAARRCEAAVRGAGAIPAVVAVVAGRLRCGLSLAELEAFARGEGRPRKVGARDLAPALLGGTSGGTTVSATCAVAGALGLPVFATGGIGGVHRGGNGDVSEDLHALAGYRGAVVCSGAKSILDLPRTLEALESLGILVVGFGTSDLPAFYAAGSGLPLAHRVDAVGSAAELLRTHRDRLGQPGALLLCAPPPPAVALDPRQLEAAVHAALDEAGRQRISGSAMTPFLLGQLVRSTGGQTLLANVALLERNARLAAELAVAYAAG